MARKLTVMLVLAGMCILVQGARADVTDNFDTYTAGAAIPAGNGWVGWGGQEFANGIVSDAQANSGPNSLAVVGGAGTDQVLEFGYAPKTGSWVFTTMTFVPSAGKSGETYFNLMNKFDEAGGVYQWSTVEVHWMMDPAHADVDKVFIWTNPAGALPIAYDTWVEVSAEIDLTANACEIFYGGVSLGATTWTQGADPLNGIDVLDIFPISANASVMYYDDISLTEVPEPATMSLLALGGLTLVRRRKTHR
jgi:hypothetical protein